LDYCSIDIAGVENSIYEGSAPIHMWGEVDRIYSWSGHREYLPK